VTSDDDLPTLPPEILEHPAPPAPARPRALLLDHLTGRAPFAGFASRFSRIFQLPEAAALRLLASIAATPWDPMMPGVGLQHFSPGAALQGPGVDAGFVSFASDLVFPFHAHGGEETTLVLQGGFVDELTGRHLLPGDILRLPAGSAHQFRIDRGETCLGAVLLLGPLSFGR